MEQYSEYKDSGIQWLGKIPRHWKVCKFPYCSKLLNAPCKLQSSQYEPIGIFPIVSQEKDLINGYWNNEDDVLHIDNPVIIFGDHTKTIKYVDFNFVVGADGVRIISPSFDYVQKYYYYSLLSLPLITLGYSRHFKLLKDKYLPLPPLAEQRGIVAYLDEKCGKIDKLLEGKQKQIELLAETKQRVIADTVTRGLNPNVKMKPTNIPWLPQIPEHWMCNRVKIIADLLFKGNGIPKDVIFDDGDTPCVRYGEIYSKYSQSFSTTFSKTKIAEIDSPRLITYGDILCAGTGELVSEIGKSIVYLGKNDCLVGGDIVVIRHSQDPAFFNYAFNSEYAQHQKSFGRAKLKVVHISSYELGNVRIAFPPLCEQESIVRYLDDKCAKIDTLSAKLRQEIGAIKEYKQRLISDVVTGQMKVC